MIATRDIGKVAAETLLAASASAQTIDLDGHGYTERDVADQLAATLGKPLDVVTVPRAGWVDTMVEAGLPVQFAHELAALYDAGERGILQAHGDRSVACTTPIGETLRHVVEAATNQTPAA